MALWHVPYNFVWRIESIAPSYERYGVKRFRSIDPLTLNEMPSGTGGIRMFYVEWPRYGEDDENTLRQTRESEHEFVVNVFYPATLPYMEMLRIVTSDRDDLIETLRDSANRVGYNASNTTDDIGLMVRRGGGGDLDQSSDVWVHTMVWRCRIRETEL